MSKSKKMKLLIISNNFIFICHNKFMSDYTNIVETSVKSKKVTFNDNLNKYKKNNMNERILKSNLKSAQFVESNTFVNDDYYNDNISDPTDVIDNNECNIHDDIDEMNEIKHNSDSDNNEYNEYDEYGEYNEYNDKMHIRVIKQLEQKFFSKYNHLENFKNRSIIEKMCAMAIYSIPSKILDIEYYMNFLESSINQLLLESNINILETNIDDTNFDQTTNLSNIDNKINKINEINEINKINKINEINEINKINKMTSNDVSGLEYMDEIFSKYK